MRTIERHLQQCINRIENWASHNGFKFSKSKAQCVHFCQLRKVHNDPELYLCGSLMKILNFLEFFLIVNFLSYQLRLGLICFRCILI